MKITWAIGSLYVAFECARRASGGLPDPVFSENFRWMWWLLAVFWLTAGVDALLARIER